MSGNMSPSRGSGMERGLTFGPGTADRGGMGSSWARRTAQARAGRSLERGQALVEFALILPLFLVLLVGLVQFGVGLNYWLDMHRLANQGARWGVVDCNPKSTGVCDPDIRTALEWDRTSGGNKVEANVCFEGNQAVGEPLRVELKSVFGFKKILFNMPGITLRATAVMRIEQAPSATGLLKPASFYDDAGNPTGARPAIGACPP